MNARSKKRLTAALVLLIALVLTATGVYTLAEYVKSSKSKRVLAAVGSAGSPFSSNYLTMNADPSVNVYKHFFYAGGSGIAASGDVTVCNYPQGNNVSVYGEDIPYRLTARWVMVSESGGVYTKTDATAGEVGSHTAVISFNGGTPVTLDSGTLSHDFGTAVLDRHAAQTDVYSVTFDSDFSVAGSLCLYLIAEPTVAQPGITALDSVFSVALNAGETRNQWTGAFTDDTAAGDPAQPDYDGFNYAVSGTGSGTVTLTWDNTKLQISQVFLARNSLTPTVSGTSTSVSFAVDSDTVSRYDLQFYYADETVAFADWAALTGSVALTYTES